MPMGAHLPPMPPGTLTRWSLSRPTMPSPAIWNSRSRPLELGHKWQDVEAEPPGFVVSYRYREAPHPRVSFASDFSKRLTLNPE